jgi:hypothetical protein
MAQGVLPFKYEEEKNKTGMTAMAGLPTYLDLSKVMGLHKSIEEHVGIRRETQGWTDAQMVSALILLNLAGGDCVEDLRVLEGDEGFCRVLERSQLHGLRRRERRKLEKRWRKEKKRGVPSPSAAFRYLSGFHNAEQEAKRQIGKAFIPESNEHLKGLCRINRQLLNFVQNNNPISVATLDMDATLVETNKKDALYCYKGFKSYQPLNTWWAEQEVVVHTEFRDGNVPAGYEQLRVLTEAIECLPPGVEKVRLRSDTAGYQHELLKYCQRGDTKGFGKIEFAIGCDVTREFKKAVGEVKEEDWHPLYSEKNSELVASETQWAEVCFVPHGMGYRKDGPVYRYIAKRTALTRQKELPGIEAGQLELPFPTMEMERQQYKVFGIVTNMDWEGGRLIRWHHERCGKSEQAHSVMKEDLAGGKLPSDGFGENAAWWWIMILALNLNAVMKSLVLGADWVTRRMKTIRFSLINLPGRIVKRTRSMLIRLPREHPMLELLIEARRRIAQLIPAPG